MTGSAAPGRESRSAQDSAFKSMVSVVASVGIPVTLLAGLMFYFGWARTFEQARKTNLDVSLYGLTAQDFILRSIDALYLPLLCLGILGLAWLGLHQWIQRPLAIPRLRSRFRAVGRAAFVAGIVVAVAGLLLSQGIGRFIRPLGAMAGSTVGAVAVPLSIAFGTAVAGYGLWLGRAATPASARRPLSLGQRAMRAGFIAGIIGLAIFWGLGSYATIKGRERASNVVRDLATYPKVTAYSPTPLGVDGLEPFGVREELVNADPPLYRIEGLRLLMRAGGRMFLLHDFWTPDSGRVIVVPDDGGVIWQFSKGYR